MNYVNGDIYDGQWIDDSKNGVGICNFSNGDKYNGGWKADERSGKGKVDW